MTGSSTLDHAGRILDALGRIDEILGAGHETNAMYQRALLERALAVFLDIFGSDRVFMIFVGQSPSGNFEVPIECTHPDWPGAQAMGVRPVVDAFNRQTMGEAHAHMGEVRCYGPGHRSLPADCDLRTSWGVQTMMLVAMQPRGAPTWYLGAHYCREPRQVGYEAELLARLGRRLSDAVSSMISIEQLQESEARYRTLVENAVEAIVLIDAEQQCFIDCNTNAEAVFGWPLTKLLTLSVPQLSPELQPGGQSSVELAGAYLAATCAGQPQTFEWVHVAADGRLIPCEVRLVRVPSTTRTLVRASVTDISGRKVLEQEREHLAEQLRRAQKLEAIGRLTGGIAHDFNNLLTIISGQLELIELERSADRGLCEDLAVARDACGRAAALTHQLLAFARQKTLLPQQLQLSAEVSKSVGLLRRTLGEGIEVSLVLDDDIRPCKVDPNQLTNVVLNLCINARDAMAHGGKIELSTQSLTLAPGERVDVDGEDIVGEFAVLSVRDDGSGIAPYLLGRVFEPFVSTKDASKGTGLGLSMVYGIVKQSGGRIQLDSEVGVGTHFWLYFPAVDGPVASPVVDAHSGPISLGHSELLLVLEDDDVVRRLLLQMLESAGYRCLEAGRAEGALELLRARTDIDLLISDMVLSGGARGMDVALEARRLHPSLPVLFVSGYSQEHSRAEFVEVGGSLLEKPFTRAALVAKVAHLLRFP